MTLEEIVGLVREPPLPPEQVCERKPWPAGSARLTEARAARAPLWQRARPWRWGVPCTRVVVLMPVLADPALDPGLPNAVLPDPPPMSDPLPEATGQFDVDTVGNDNLDVTDGATATIVTSPDATLACRRSSSTSPNTEMGLSVPSARHQPVRSTSANTATIV